MNVAKLWIIAEEFSDNIRTGAVVAVRYAGDAEWSDPHGGFFNQPEQESLDALARGRSVHVQLDGIRGPRVFRARLVGGY